MPAAQPVPEERSLEARNSNELDSAVAGDGGPGLQERDDIIRDQREVFEMARGFGLFDQDRGS